MDLYEKFITINKKKKILESKIEESLEKKYKSKHPILYYVYKFFNADSIKGLLNLLILSIVLFMSSVEKTNANGITLVFVIAFAVCILFAFFITLSIGLKHVIDEKKAKLRKKERTIFKLDLNKINKELSDLTETEENKYEIAKKIYIKENEKSELTKEEKTFLKSYRLKVYDDYLKDESVEIINE
jgi:hypothetical protein